MVRSIRNVAKGRIRARSTAELHRFLVTLSATGTKPSSFAYGGCFEAQGARAAAPSMVSAPYLRPEKT